MPQEVLDFIKGERVGVIAVQMPDGSPHGATVHFAFMENPSTFIFMTSPDYKKSEPLKRGPTRASFVIGTSEAVMKTLQIDGEAQLAESEEVKKIYFEKFPEKAGKNLTALFFTFTPAWWRFTDWTKPKGKMVLSSEEAR
jgi:uncharacterized protein YhbP (UPF0306 family)